MPLEIRVPPILEAKGIVGDPLGDLPPESVIFGSSEAMQAVREMGEKIAATSAPILITGETGTGKELLARQIHRKSPWHASPLFKINCPVLRASRAVADPFVDAILTAAISPVVEGDPDPHASRSTLLLNEIGFLDAALQVRLLERLQDDAVLRLQLPDGNSWELRVICATSRDLDRDVEAGQFLRELYYLVKVLNLELPPLRQRRDDIPQLTAYFLDTYNVKFSTQTPPPPRRIMRQMSDYNWPGNIRELANLMMRYTIQGSEEAFAGELGAHETPQTSFGALSKTTIPLKKVARQAVEELERKIIRKVLEEHHWNRKQAARALNISYRALLYKIKDAGVPPKRVTRAAPHAKPISEEPDEPTGEKREDTPV